MALLSISLRCDPETGKKDIVVKLHSDPDTLPLEHEQQHRALVDKLIEGGVLDASEVGKIVVERHEAEPQATPIPSPSASPMAERAASRQGG